MTKRKNKPVAEKDPHRAREQKKYANPIPSREFIMELLAEEGTPMSREEIATRLALTDEDQLEALRRRLNAMERDGQLVRNRRGALCLVNKKDLIAGRVIAHQDGFGFLRPDEGGDDLFLSPRQMHALLHGDRAVVRVVGIDRRGRREAALVEVLERHNTHVVGRLYVEHGVGFVVPDNKRITQEVVVPEKDFAGATHGQIVRAEILEHPTKRTQPVGRIVRVMGEHMAPGMETEIAIQVHGIRTEWPESVEQEIATLDREVPESAGKGRVDLRQHPLVTIDGADARDFDDAVCCEKKPKGWKLWVCIADVSSYVELGTALDGEARTRATSVYFPDRVIPMLPEVLSNGLCSINPEVDRLCMVCELYVNREGEITRSKFYRGLMRSHARLTYDQVADMVVKKDKGLRRQHAAVVPHLDELHRLFKVLNKARQKRGAIDFDTVETRIVFNDEAKVERIVPVQRNDAHRMIEECMLAANVAAARFLLRKKIPALFRVHEGPKEDKLTDLRSFLGEVGLTLNGGKKPSARDYADVLEAARGRPDFHLIQTVLLRSMSQAVYSPDNVGHFGLAFPAYTHFTSPIRRYPDLIVHRAIKHALDGGKAEDFVYSQSQLETLGEHCSTNERTADEATRDATSWLKCEYMLDKVGESFDGIISSVTSFGLFVELNEIYVEGLVHITSLDNDYYHFDPIGHRLTGERSGQVYRMGDPIRVKVASVSLDEKKIDFALDQASGEGPAKAGRRRKRPSEAPKKAPDRDDKRKGKGKDKGKKKPARAEAEVKPKAAGKRRRRRKPKKSGSGDA